MKSLVKEAVDNYLAFWARVVLWARRPTVIGVTGSAGKTTTVAFIAAVLTHPAARRFVGGVRKTYGNMNDNRGLPLVVLGYERWGTDLQMIRRLVSVPFRALALTTFKPYPDVLVLEYAASFGGDVARLAAMARPTVAVVTAVGPAHLDRFGTVERVAEEKAALVRAVEPGGLVVLGADNSYAAGMAVLSRAKVVMAPGAGRELSANVARAVASFLKVPSEAVDHALAVSVAVTGRLDITADGAFTVIDDAFNANPLSMQHGLDVLAEHAARQGQRAVAVLGEMAELGAQTEHYHSEIGAYAWKRAQVVVGVGELARNYRPDHWYQTSDDCSADLPTFLRPGDCVYVKGSHSSHLDQTVRRLKALAREWQTANVGGGQT